MAESKRKQAEDALERLRVRMDDCQAVRSGDIDLHLSGPSGGDYRFRSGTSKTTISGIADRDARSAPVLEVWADPDIIRAIIDGKKDPVKQFLLGGMRVRGNLRYLSDVGVELGILDRPL